MQAPDPEADLYLAKRPNDPTGHPTAKWFGSRSRLWTVLTYTNEGFLDFMDNWLTSVEYLGIRDRFTIVSRDNVSYEHIVRKWKDALNLKVINGTPAPSKSLLYTHKDYHKFVGYKPELILKFLETGLDVLFTDLDMVWMQDPRPYLPEGYDLHIMHDKLAENGRIYLCTGFMFWTSNSKTLEFVQAWTKAMETAEHDQMAFTQLFNKSKIGRGLRINILDHKRFVSGNYYFNETWRETNERIEPVVIHNNYAVGHDKKKNRFQKAGLWFIE